MNVAWVLTGVAFLAVLVILAMPVLRGGGEGAAGPTATPTATPGALPDISSMTPREAAERLFDRVMRAASAGNTAEVTQFLPMAVSAYERARPLDEDGFFHLALLRQTGADHAGALQAGEECLAVNPDHLLCLSVSASSADELGQEDVARDYFQHALDVWDDQVGLGREDYEAHESMLTGIRQEAVAYVGG